VPCSSNDIGPEGAAALATHFKRLTNLQSFVLRYETGGERKCVHLKNLQSLNL
jgi:hypothetical protein